MTWGIEFLEEAEKDLKNHPVVFPKVYNFIFHLL